MTDPKGFDEESMTRHNPTTIELPTEDEEVLFARLFAHHLDLPALVARVRSDVLQTGPHGGREQSVRLVRISHITTTPIPWRQKCGHWVLSVNDAFSGDDHHMLVDPRPSAIAAAPIPLVTFASSNTGRIDREISLGTTTMTHRQVGRAMSAVAEAFCQSPPVDSRQSGHGGVHGLHGIYWNCADFWCTVAAVVCEDFGARFVAALAPEPSRKGIGPSIVESIDVATGTQKSVAGSMLGDVGERELRVGVFASFVEVSETENDNLARRSLDHLVHPTPSADPLVESDRAHATALICANLPEARVHKSETTITSTPCILF